VHKEKKSNGIQITHVVIGLEHGIQGMCIGEIRRLIVPSTLHVCKFLFVLPEKKSFKPFLFFLFFCVANDGQISDKGKLLLFWKITRVTQTCLMISHDL
jgi:hypothetical protein